MRRRLDNAAVSATSVLGIDRFAGGWVGALLDTSGVAGFRVARSFADLVATAPDAACVAVDMPIGLPESGVREADAEARKFVGPRSSSVFMTPPLAVLEADSFEEANKIAPNLLDGRRISRQTWSLKATIFEVDEVARLDERVIEVHPEVSFRGMAAQELIFSKHSWNGVALRRAALAEAGLSLPDVLEIGGNVPPADVLDALAAAWSARRLVAGQACVLPEAATPGDRGTISY
jgi:predicted RNase H-like nuclease